MIYACPECAEVLVYKENDYDNGERHYCPKCGKIYPNQRRLGE